MARRRGPSCRGAWGDKYNGDNDATGISVPSHSTVLNARGDAAYGPLVVLDRDCDGYNNIKVDVEFLDPEIDYWRPGNALARVNGIGHNVRIWRRDVSSKKMKTNENKDLTVYVGTNNCKNGIPSDALSWVALKVGVDVFQIK